MGLPSALVRRGPAPQIPPGDRDPPLQPEATQVAILTAFDHTGDFPWKDKGPGLTAEPELVTREVTAADKYLVLGSDGLFDVLPNKAIARLVGKMASSAQKVCNELVRELKKRPGQDDVTLMVVQFRHGEKREEASATVTNRTA